MSYLNIKSIVGSKLSFVMTENIFKYLDFLQRYYQSSFKLILYLSENNKYSFQEKFRLSKDLPKLLNGNKSLALL